MLLGDNPPVTVEPPTPFQLADPPPPVVIEPPVTVVMGDEPPAYQVPDGYPIPGPAGRDAGILTLTAGGTINPLTVVAIHPDGLAYAASSLNPDDPERVVGIATTGALAGESFTAASGGEIPSNTPRTVGPLYLGADGAMTPTIPGGTQLRVAYAVTPTRIAVRISVPIVLL